MREIKFRAWNPLAPESGMSPLLTLEEMLEIWGEQGNLPGDNTNIYMQYTGLKDKNGVEIYEGDVVVVGDGGQYLGEDYNEDDEAFDTDRFQVYWETESSMFYIKGLDGKHVDLEFSPFGYATFEVIGNIYENPELLEPAQEGK